MAGYGQAADVAWKVGRIMLKYRPIAPRPLPGGAFSAVPVDAKSGSGRGKRKRAGCLNGTLKGGGRRARKSTNRPPAAAPLPVPAAVVDESSSSTLVTLSLLPGTPEPEEVSPATPSPAASDVPVPASYFAEPAWRRRPHAGAIANNSNNSGGGGSSSSVVAPRPARPVGSWVTVECVTDTWREGEAGPSGLVGDALPLFVSDACAFSSRMAALDFIVCDGSDAFVTNNNGNMAKILAGRRRYFGHKRTIRPNAKRLYSLFLNRGNSTWEAFASKVRTFQRGFMGEPNEVRPGRGEFHENPSACICEDPEAKKSRPKQDQPKVSSKGRKEGLSKSVAEPTYNHDTEEDNMDADEEPEVPDFDDEENQFQAKSASNGTGLDYDLFARSEDAQLEEMFSD